MQSRNPGRLFCFLLLAVGAQLLLAYDAPLFAQNSTTQRFQLQDLESGRPVVYATVVLMPDKIGVIADQEGSFSIPKERLTPDKTLLISCMGYTSLNLAVSELPEVETISLTMRQKVEKIEEVTLQVKKKEKKLSPRQIVKRAIDKIPENYPQEAHAAIAYYRDYQRITDSLYLNSPEARHSKTYYNLNEGILELFDAGFDSHILFDDRNQAAFYQFRAHPDFPRDSSLAVPYDNKSTKFMDGVLISPLGGNELNLIYLTNAIRNHEIMSFSFVHVLEKNFIKNHRFNLEGLAYFDDEPFYALSFETEMERINSTYKGKGLIYVSKIDFGIKNFQYDLYDLKKKRHLYGVKIDYQLLGQKYYLSYLTFNNYFEATKTDYFKILSTDYHIKDEGFHVRFNAEVDPLSLGEPWGRKFQFFQGNRKLKVTGVQRLDKKLVLVKVKDFDLSAQQQMDQALYFSIENVYDILGRRLDETETFTVDQFRELFVQEVFPVKALDRNLKFIDKEEALSASEINPLPNAEKYWMNSPMKPKK